MKTKTTQPDPQETSRFRWKLLIGVFASVALYLLGVTYWINSEPAGEETPLGRAHDPSAARAAADRDEAIRVRMRKADENLLKILAERNSSQRVRTDAKQSRLESVKYVNSFKAQVLDAIDSVGPAALPLAEDLREKAEDPDFTAEYQ